MMTVLMLVDHELTITTSDDDGELVGGDLLPLRADDDGARSDGELVGGDILPLLDDDAGPAGDYHFPSQRF